ncbi:MAG TPA: hypothetical protein VKT51_00255 [Candidatus Eremiobacteraceae bacterium]|nr:hypothetical protein [Candidatus Eremiobacteraceae bacterium]
MTAEIKSYPVASAQAFCASRESADARRLYGAPFVTAPSIHALAATDVGTADAGRPAESIVGALVYTLCGGVAEIESIAIDAAHPDAGDALVRRFEEAASYNNCHKLVARVKQAGAEQTLLERLRFRVTAVLERHFFQAHFVDMVKWIA